MSYLTESNLQGTVAYRDSSNLRTIPEDRSEAASIEYAAQSPKRSWTISDEIRSVALSSTGGVVDDKPEIREEPPEKALPRASPRCQLWKVVAGVSFALLACAVGAFFFATKARKSRGKSSKGQTSPSTLFPTPAPAPTTADRDRDIFFAASGESLFNRGTPQNRAFRWMVFEDEAKVQFLTHGRFRVLQRYALAVLYFSTDGENWDTSNFRTADNECGWDGITCFNGKVVDVYLPSMGLNGTLPKELGKLPNLQRLDLSLNFLTGTIAKALYGAPQLRSITLSHNQLEGTIHQKVWKLEYLRGLYLNNNALSGSLPNIATKKNHSFPILAFDVRYNKLTGQIPSNYSKLSNLQGFLISGNQLSGTILEALYSFRNLRGIFLADNRFEGSISEKIWSMPALSATNFSNNLLTGSVPPLPSSISAGLIGMDWSSNHLSGQLPSGLFKLTSVTALLLCNNSFTGTFPVVSSPSSLSLKHIDFSWNNLTGTLPPALWEIPDLESLDLYVNKFEGPIPEFPPGTTPLKLKNFWVQNNSLTGTLAFDWSRLQNLEDLLLYGNNLVSDLPQSLFDLPNLTYVDLSENGFSGTFPQLQFASSLKYLYVNDNQLQGPIPAELPLLLEDVWFNANNFSGRIPDGFASASYNLTVALLHENSLTGSVPSSVCTSRNWSRLEVDCRDATRSNYVACTDGCCTRCY